MRFDGFGAVREGVEAFIYKVCEHCLLLGFEAQGKGGIPSSLGTPPGFVQRSFGNIRL